MSSDEGADAADEFASVNSIIVCASLLALIAVGYRINMGVIRHLPESGAAMLLGLLVGGAVRLLGFVEEEDLLNFKGEFFFFVLLPPIIFEAGLSLETKIFVDNLGAILTFAVLGTIISTWVVSYGLRVAARTGLIGLEADSPRLVICCHLFGALISATDPVATIALFGGSRFRTDPLLHSLVNGESILNDAVAIVLFTSLTRHVDDKTPHLLSVDVLGHFCLVSVGSLILGLCAGALCSAIFKSSPGLSRFPDYEIAAMCLGAYLTFASTQLLGLSGIVALFFFGVVLAHYNWYNLSEPSKVSSKVTFRTMAMLAEACVFIYLGVVTGLSIGRFHWHFGLVLFACLLIGVARAAHIFPCSWVLNMYRRQKIGGNMQAMMWVSGLRGAIAFALSLRIPCNVGQDLNRGQAECRNSDLLVTTTISIVMLTTMVVGTSLETVATELGVMNVDGEAADEALLPLSRQRTPELLSRSAATRARGEAYQAFATFDLEVLQPALGGPKCVRVTGEDVELPNLQGFIQQPGMARHFLAAEEEEEPPMWSRASVFE